VQAPRSITGRLDVGVGVSYPWLSGGGAAPYATLGRINANGRGWVAAAGYVGHVNPDVISSSGRENVFQYSLAYQRTDQRGVNQVFVQGVHASGVTSCDPT